ncbi:hypothetical protein Pmani_000731 [Petrolisthes manimaculis]|uniref:Uncharacterized protein n=1 Tax=Petrolisthes manimaculis TaxID=1843537 RepID=A0AAE1UQ18_9EUCA|nr:hypothetical protein Pmani_000731 [Petrolisthes manimaculis]
MSEPDPTHPRHCSREGRTLIKIISTEVISSARSGFFISHGQAAFPAAPTWSENVPRRQQPANSLKSVGELNGYPATRRP